MNKYSLVLFAVICQNEIFELHLHLDPFFVGERGPDVMRLGDGGLVRLQDHLGAVIVDVQRSEDQDESGEGLEMEQSSKQKLFTRGISRCHQTSMHDNTFSLVAKHIFFLTACYNFLWNEKCNIKSSIETTVMSI